MSNFIITLKQNRKAIIFLLKFIVLYFVLNTIYGLYVESYYPSPDPFTIFVASHSSFIISLFQNGVDNYTIAGSQYVPITLEGQTIISIFEGCNSINVLIVFFVFLIAYNASIKQTVVFTLIGTVILYMINLGRIVGLFYVALYFPGSLYFIHKFVFTGVIYAVVFFLWFLWVKKAK